MLIPLDYKAMFATLRTNVNAKAERQRQQRFSKTFRRIYRKIKKNKSFFLTLEDIKYLSDDRFFYFPSIFGEDSLGREREKRDKNIDYSGTFGKFIEEAQNAGLHFEHLWQYDSEGIRWDVNGFKITLQN